MEEVSFYGFEHIAKASEVQHQEDRFPAVVRLSSLGATVARRCVATCDPGTGGPSPRF